MNALRYLGLGVGYVLAGLVLACLLVALALPAMVYIVFMNWKEL